MTEHLTVDESKHVAAKIAEMKYKASRGDNVSELARELDEYIENTEYAKEQKRRQQEKELQLAIADKMTPAAVALLRTAVMDYLNDNDRSYSINPNAFQELQWFFHVIKTMTD